MNYYELNTTTNFTFLTGASHPEEYVQQAIALGYRGIAITDECSVAGVVRAYIEINNQKKQNHCDLKLIVGSYFQITQEDHDEPISLLLLCPSRQAYAELSAFITRARRRAEKGSYLALTKDLENYLNHVLVIWLPGNNEQSYQQAKLLKKHFEQRLWIGYQRLRQADDYAYYQHCLQLAEYFDLPMVAQNNVLMHHEQRLDLQHCLTAIRLNQTIDSLGNQLTSNAEQHLRSLNSLQQLYPESLLKETESIANLCDFCLSSLKYEYPDEVIPKEKTASEHLRQLCFDGAKERWPKGIPKKVTRILKYELDVIKKLSYEHYFLTVHDIVAFARSENILCQGRGSAANSAVCYCLGVTEVDPNESELLFERFISEERDEPPDIDVDFEHQRREEVIQYIYKKYSRERTALTATVITYRMRSAIRDVGKAFGIDANILEYLSRSLAWWDKPESLLEYFSAKKISTDAQMVQHFYRLVMEILRFPRHLSQHVGGFVISQGPLSNLVPVENASMEDRTVIQWDKYDIEALKLLKVDVLGLGMLTMLRKCLEMTSTYCNVNKFSDIPKEDKRTYQMLSRGDTIGVFQIESRAQMSMLPRLKPKCFYDLVIEIAIVRPGPIQGDMVHPYLRRRDGIEEPHYPNKDIEKVLERTLGVPIFQEQVIQMAMVAAGFTGGEADQLRRAMATWGRNGDLYKFKEKLINGMLKKGYDQSYAERLFEQMKGFGSYGFPESHSASFAILAYFSSWLKRHHPAAFYCALLNSQPMGFYSPSQLVQDAKRHYIQVHAINVDDSEWFSTIVNRPKESEVDKKQPDIRLGLHLVKGFNEDAAERLVMARKQRPFANLKDLVERAQLNQIEREALVQANVLPRLSPHRYQAQWQSLAIEQNKPLLSALENSAHYDLNDNIELTAPTEVDSMLFDYQRTGLTLNRHPIEILRESYPVSRCKKANQLRQMQQGQFVRIAGVITCKQRPGTAAGVLFLTLEDETGNMNIIVWRNTVEKFRKVILSSHIVMIKGLIEREKNVVHVVAGHITDISKRLPNFKRKSRDFH